jgi:hypothetical protein
VPDPKPIMDWKRLRRMALTVQRAGATAADHN